MSSEMVGFPLDCGVDRWRSISEYGILLLVLMRTFGSSRHAWLVFLLLFSFHIAWDSEREAQYAALSGII
jgi:hypothetical protein